MSAAASRPRWPIWLSLRPWPLLLGVCAGFLACCVAGRIAARQQPFERFSRFHNGISPETHFYPTFSQTLNLAREQHRPGTLLVVIGGSSVLQGVGQRPEHLWSRKLQEELGEGFSVVNLAMRGGRPYEFAGLIAERLAADGVPVLFVTVALPGAGWGDWDGQTYRWLFWDAWGKGLLPDDPRRNAWLNQEFDTKYGQDEAMLEQRRRGRVDGWLFAADLWQYVAYRYVGTLWTPFKEGPLWLPHRRLKDRDVGDKVPFEKRLNPARVQQDLHVVRGSITSGVGPLLLAGRGCAPLLAEYEARLPDRLRERTLFVLRLEATYYRNLLTEQERAQYEQVYRGIVAELDRAGLNAQLVGLDWAVEDYVDRSHIGERGGAKLARELAPTIRALAERLYVRNGSRWETHR
jgi:hypothetical protein